MFKTLATAIRHSFSSLMSWIGALSTAAGIYSDVVEEFASIPSWVWWLVSVTALFAALVRVQARLDRAMATPDWDMTLREVLIRITRLPAAWFADDYEPGVGQTGLDAITDAFDDLRARTRNGMVKHVWATSEFLGHPDGSRKLVPADYWERHEIEILDFMIDRRGKAKGQSGPEELVDFRFWSAEIDRYWPKPPLIKLPKIKWRTPWQVIKEPAA